MADNIYDEIEIEDMTYDPITQLYTYPCPCGDKFEINIDDLRDGEDIAVCPSCSLMIRVIFDLEDLEKDGDAGGVQASWHVEENARNTGRRHTGWLAAQGETDFKTPLSIKARSGHSAFLGITFEGSATKIGTERARMIDCYRQGHREINRGSYFAPAVLKKTSSGSADATANAKLHALVKSGLSEWLAV
ncbi:hypothetical protein D6D28_05606 [Aureobasidium pullulans]|uniref:Diphthamide biosynthesis protein 3 n=1 Tax=Aureobasidium pullulans TaxID=5580 RepID=A0A4S8SHE4_AURPU|nr:hypothetical protein D6D28_05606 [Aureobasidium pullulans]